MSDPTFEAISKAKRQSESGNHTGAANTLEEFLRTDPHNTKARLELARIAIYGLKDEEYGLMQLEAILDIDPDNVDALGAQVTVLSKNKKNNKVVKEKLDRLMELDPTAETYNMYARFLKFQMADFKGAEQCYIKALEMEPGKYEYHQNYAVLLLNDLKDYPKAKKELEIMLDMRPGDPKVQKAYDRLMKEKFDKDGNVKKRGLFRR
jgi:tetratricopeptide (TPR) repeat protein